MAVKTQAELLAEVLTILASGSQIRAVDHRTLENDIIDTMFSPKVYKALLTQTGTDAPVATVLENTLGGTVVWTRAGVGDYVATLIGAFTVGKTIPRAPTNFESSTIIATFIDTGNANELELMVYDSGFSAVDDELLRSAVIIEVYP